MSAPSIEFQGSRLFATWLASTGASLALTSYQIGKLFLIGTDEAGQVKIFERTFDRTMALGVGPEQFWLSSRYQIWRFQNFLDPGQQHEDHDAVFVPVTGHTTGDIDVHDIHLDGEGAPLFVATRFNCLATLSATASFRPIWTPPFIDRVAAEDRCHLNGLAVQDGTAAYVTCVGKSNISDGWRDHRAGGGLVIHVPSNEIVAQGMSMPHSPRLYRGALWMLQTGTGEFGRLDPQTGLFEPLCFVPGFARGLAFIGNYAVIGMSKPRENRTFNGLKLNERLEAEGAAPKCGLSIVNLETGDVEHQFLIEGAMQEAYDVQVLPGVRRPYMLGFKSEEIQFQIRLED